MYTLSLFLYLHFCKGFNPSSFSFTPGSEHDQHQALCCWKNGRKCRVNEVVDDDDVDDGGGCGGSRGSSRLLRSQLFIFKSTDGWNELNGKKDTPAVYVWAQSPKGDFVMELCKNCMCKSADADAALSNCHCSISFKAVRKRKGKFVFRHTSTLFYLARFFACLLAYLLPFSLWRFCLPTVVGWWLAEKRHNISERCQNFRSGNQMIGSKGIFSFRWTEHCPNIDRQVDRR